MPIYDPDFVMLNYNSNVRVGSQVRFIYPENSYNTFNTTSLLEFNKVYTIRDYKITNYNQTLVIFLEGIPEIGFNAEQFVFSSTGNKIDFFNFKRFKFFLRKLKLKIKRCGGKNYYQPI
jgi:hypothetical protein